MDSLLDLPSAFLGPTKEPNRSSNEAALDPKMSDRSHKFVQESLRLDPATGVAYVVEEANKLMNGKIRVAKTVLLLVRMF
jgi:hypothetical protein